MALRDFNFRAWEGTFNEDSATDFLNDIETTIGTIALANHVRTTLKAKQKRLLLDEAARRLLAAEQRAGKE
jgi:hypothetical protein